jgi:carboxylesterase type B
LCHGRVFLADDNAAYQLLTSVKGTPDAAVPVEDSAADRGNRHAVSNGIRDANEGFPQGAQPNLGMKLPRQVEDCLTLNIWTPQ